MRKLNVWLTCALSVVLSVAAYADTTPTFEEIASFNSNIIVKDDASISVDETIKVYATGEKIKRGLIRTLPKIYNDSYGTSRRNSYNLVSVTVNGAESAHHIEETRKKFKIFVGDEHHFLKPGWYTYRFRYNVKQAVNFLKDADELYWNVTGNDWLFPILQASATVTLPPNTKIKYFRGYTGRVGAKGLNYSPTQLAPNIIQFDTTSELPPGSGLTIALAWPKGIIKEPTFMERMNSNMDLDSGSYIVIEIAVITFLYFMLAWQMYGVDPEKGAIFPRFSPPENISPAQARFIMRMGFDIKAVTASIVALATRGLITITNETDGFTIAKTDKKITGLDEEEGLILSKLFKNGNKVPVRGKNRNIFNSVSVSLKKLLQSENIGKYFVTNSKLVIPGIILLVFAAIATAYSAHDPSQAGFMIVWLSGWTAATYLLAYQVWLSFKTAHTSLSVKTLLTALFALAFAIPFFAGELFGIFMLADTVPIFTIPFLFLIATLNIVFYILLKQPTAEGRKLMDEIEGFRMYLNTTEKHRLESYEPPKMSEELFEKYLAYAIALDVENSWGQQLNQQLIESGKSPESYQPAWYSGSNWSASSPSAFGAVVGSGLSSALSSTSVSSSASSGGGFSGGGGGGGGGGGW